MKRSATIILLVISIISGTEREILKFPVLLQHFQEHKQLDDKITFVRFLIDHYNDVPHTDNDEERDNQLPFKKIDFNIQASPVLPDNFYVDLRKPVQPASPNVFFPKNDTLIPSANVNNIWQPPKAGNFYTVA